jgi:large subunit ribosomal protein L13
METKSTRKNDIKRAWYKIDVKGLILGRVATDIAQKLMGKSKPYFVPSLDCGDYVVVVNARNVRVTGKKELQKSYYRHSNYPGGLKSNTLGKLRECKPEEIIRQAVMGMLPQNKLRAGMLKRLLIFPEDNHPYSDKFKGD